MCKIGFIGVVHQYFILKNLNIENKKFLAVSICAKGSFIYVAVTKYPTKNKQKKKLARKS